MQIDATKSNILLPLLESMRTALLQINKKDIKLQNLVKEILGNMSRPNSIFAEGLLGLLDRIKWAVSSYDLKPHDGWTPGNYVTALPGILYAAKMETEHLINTQTISQSHPSTALALLQQCDHFLKLASC